MSDASLQVVDAFSLVDRNPDLAVEELRERPSMNEPERCDEVFDACCAAAVGAGLEAEGQVGVDEAALDLEPVWWAFRAGASAAAEGEPWGAVGSVAEPVA
ncbi:hypothetical protein [Myceligenerans indicum]|uniref:Uncharacterized protein n=1 Tax=Myceligenerans indicum TaxID=2593663 RepID=A0ABS1LR96_9MICO|nr:hypothetical protein [Myceligenerans indicum]MBL0888720.1 hypothetical protein [Myceligenerans indicum]